MTFADLIPHVHHGRARHASLLDAFDGDERLAWVLVQSLAQRLPQPEPGTPRMPAIYAVRNLQWLFFQATVHAARLSPHLSLLEALMAGDAACAFAIELRMQEHDQDRAA